MTPEQFATAAHGDQLLCKLRVDLINKRFCSDINNPNIFVTVVNVCRANRGFQVVFKYGDNDPIFCGYRKFIKRYPYELRHKLTKK